MLGEAARTERDARRYQLAYSNAIGRLADASHSDDIRENPGISIKLSALHPRYESAAAPAGMDELVPRAGRSRCWRNQQGSASTSMPKKPGGLNFRSTSSKPFLPTRF